MSDVIRMSGEARGEGRARFQPMEEAMSELLKAVDDDDDDEPPWHRYGWMISDEDEEYLDGQEPFPSGSLELTVWRVNAE
jgi:hypothetical protein